MRNLVIFSLALLPLALPFFVSAAVMPSQLVPCDGTDCNVCHLASLGNNILQFLVVIGVLIAAILIAVNGFKMVTAAGNESQLASAKSGMTNVVVGFIILLAAWLIINAVMEVLAGGEVDGKAWQDILCEGGSTVTASTGGGGFTTGGGFGGGGFSTGGGIVVGTTPPTGGDVLTHDDALATLGSDIVVTSTNGPSGVNASCNTSGCTSLEGIQQDTLSAPLALKDACPDCDVVVTGGTEALAHGGGEYSHGTGYKIDIDDTPAVQTFLEDNLTPAGSDSSGTLYTDASGNVWRDEGSHWDVQVIDTVTFE